MKYYDFDNLDEFDCANAFIDVVNFYGNSSLVEWREKAHSYTDEEIRLFEVIEQGFYKAWNHW